jgi:hypothetical protein
MGNLKESDRSGYLEDMYVCMRVKIKWIKGPLGTPRRRWEDKIKMDLQKVGCRGLDWIELAQDRDRWRAFFNAATSLRVP